MRTWWSKGGGREGEWGGNRDRGDETPGRSGLLRLETKTQLKKRGCCGRTAAKVEENKDTFLIRRKKGVKKRYNLNKGKLVRGRQNYNKIRGI